MNYLNCASIIERACWVEFTCLDEIISECNTMVDDVLSISFGLVWQSTSFSVDDTVKNVANSCSRTIRTCWVVITVVPCAIIWTLVSRHLVCETMWVFAQVWIFVTFLLHDAQFNTVVDNQNLESECRDATVRHWNSATACSPWATVIVHLGIVLSQVKVVTLPLRVKEPCEHHLTCKYLEWKISNSQKFISLLFRPFFVVKYQILERYLIIDYNRPSNVPGLLYC